MIQKLLSPEQIEQANQLRLKGYSGGDIADRFGVSQTLISKYCIPAEPRRRALERKCKGCNAPLSWANTKRVYCDAPDCVDLKETRRFRKGENRDLFRTFELQIRGVLKDGAERRIKTFDELVDRLARIRMETPFAGTRSDKLLYFSDILAKELENAGLAHKLRETLRVAVRAELNRREKAAAKGEMV